VKALAILNPRAGLAARRALAALQEAGAALWPGLEIAVTTGPGHARELARQAVGGGAELVLVAGGDGTANEAAWSLAGTSVALGLVPVGSGNGLARNLGIPLDARRALPLLARGMRRRIDVGFVNERPFLNAAGAGFDAAIAMAFHERGRRGGRRGILPYVLLGGRLIFGYRCERFELVAEGQRFEGPALVVAFLNGAQYGAGAMMAPGARLDDGLLDVVVIQDAPHLELLLNAPRLFLGSIGRFRGYRRFTASSAVLSGGGPLVHHRDGEPEAAQTPLRFRVEHQALTVLAPTPSRA